MEANMAKKIWTVTLADDLINSLRFDSANVLRRIIIGKGLKEAESREPQPGSGGKRRFDQEISFAVMKIENGGWNVEKVVLPNG